MKIYEIIDSEIDLNIGCLLYFEKEKSCIIELQSSLDEWTAPLLFANRVKNGKYTMGRELCRLWVSERVIPSGRQNINSILANAKMSRYDEMVLLDKTSGKCCQDNLYIKSIKAIPEYVKERMKYCLVECVPLDNFSLLCFFVDGTIRKVNIQELNRTSDIRKIISNELVFKSGHIALGGYIVTFNDSLDIEASVLYESGVEIPLELNDFYSFVKSNVLDSSECCFLLECTRQNLTNYTSKDILVPIKADTKGNLYTRGNIYRNEILKKMKEQRKE